MDLSGVYYDPKHGGCVRLVTRRGKAAWLIEGAYGDDEPGRPGTGWSAHARSDGGHFVTVDFFNKRTHHARVYHALWCPEVRELHWEDGNVWKKMYSQYDA